MTHWQRREQGFVLQHRLQGGGLELGVYSFTKISWMTNDSKRTGSAAIRVLSSSTGSREGVRWQRLTAELAGLPCSGCRSSPAQEARRASATRVIMHEATKVPSQLKGYPTAWFSAAGFFASVAGSEVC